MKLTAMFDPANISFLWDSEIQEVHFAGNILSLQDKKTQCPI
jgi:hypothetical protein